MAWALRRKRGAGGLSAGAVGGECDHLNAPAESWVDRGERHSWVRLSSSARLPLASVSVVA